MIKILEDNLIRKEIVCPKCNSKLAYGENDFARGGMIRLDSEGNAIRDIICPVCNSNIVIH